MNLYHYITPATTACEKRIELSKIKMGEKCPARDLQRSSPGTLLLTCLTLVTICVTSTSDVKECIQYAPRVLLLIWVKYLRLDQVQDTASTQPSPALPGMNMTGQFSRFVQRTTPPTTGTYLMECSGSAYDHCWLDENTMVLADYGRVLKVTVNRENKTCTYSKLGSDPKASRLACSPEGQEIYVIDNGQSYLWVYDRNNLKAIWTPEGIVGRPYTVAINSQIIMVGTYERGPVYMYNRDRVYLGQIKILQNRYKFDFTRLTEEGLFLATTATDGHRLIIHDIAKGSTVSVGGQGSGNGQFNIPIGFSAIGAYIVVCDRTNERLPIIHKNGQFQNNLLLKGEVITCKSIDYRSGTNILATSNIGGAVIKLYTLD